MLYRALKTITINLDSKATIDLDAHNSTILIPNSGSKVYIHWLTESGKIRQTFTMNFATQVQGKIKLINGLDKPAQIQVIHLD
jgi:hypothetical protein